MATVPMIAETRFVIDEVSWEAYEALLKCWESRSKRMTYDQGRLEFMRPSFGHENLVAVIGQMVRMFTLERRLPIHSGRMVTMKREDMQRGLEADDCFWIQYEPQMRCQKEFDPDQDPPPDLAIEIETTSSSLPRMSIYASLGVPEVWRFDGSTFTINLLHNDDTYEGTTAGRALPELTTDIVTRFLQMSDQMGEMELLATFVEWVRDSGQEVAQPKQPRRPPRK